MIDIVGLKRINDEHGHAAGDAALLSFVSSLRQSMRADDIAFRFGGDEFVVLAQGSTASALEPLFDRARPTSTPFTVGLAESPIDGTTEAALLAVADKRMYERRRPGPGPTPVPARSRRRRLTATTAGAALALLALGGPVLAWTRQPAGAGRPMMAATSTLTTHTPEGAAATPTTAGTSSTGGVTAGAAVSADTSVPMVTAAVRRGSHVVVAPATATPASPTTRSATSPSPATTPTTTTSTPTTSTPTTQVPVEAAAQERHGKPDGHEPKPHKPHKPHKDIAGTRR